MDTRRLGDPGSDAFQVDKYPFYLLNRAVGRYNVIIGGRLRSIGLDIPSWRVLMILGERAPRSVGEIADKAVINLSTMMRIIQRMEDAGLVTSAARPEDGRVREVFLADHGVEMVAAARAITAPIYAALIDGFSPKDFDRLIDMLGQLDANLAAIEP